MKIENSAKEEKGFIEKSLAIQSCDDGTYKITAKELPLPDGEDRRIEMSFTANGLAALLGSWLATSGRKL